jgi:gluconate 5-dehydrogenase
VRADDPGRYPLGVGVLDRFRLDGRIALVTGGSRGIGLTLARGLGEAGATVVINGRDETRLASAAEELRGQGITTHTIAFDVTDAAAVADAIDRLEARVGPLDILVNNAGINVRGPLADVAPERWREILETDLTSVFLVSQAAGRRMLTRGAGKIINICSVQSELGRPTIAAYTAAKGGVKMLTKAICAEWAPHGIQVNGLGPGYIATDMTRPLREDPAFDSWLRSRTPAGRWGEPDDLIGAAVFLASSASDYVNGQILFVDGGLLAVV